MKPDAQIALESVQSEMLGTLLSIQSHREVDPTYFIRLKDAVANAAEFFLAEPETPPALLSDLRKTAQTLRNEGTVFAGREPACSEMADWLDAQANTLATARS